MARKARVAMVAVGVVAMMVDAIAVGAAATPEHEQRISAERAAALAVNDVAELGAGFRIDHPRRQVDLTPEGVRVVGRRGAPEWRWTLDGITASDGSALVATGPVAPLVVEPGLVRYDRCLLFEDYRLKQNSVEQLFVIPEPLPLGGGDLVVTGSVDCEGKLETTERGWAWRGARGEVTMGRVTVFDADGATLPARLEVTATSTRLVVDGEALQSAAYPVVVDPELGSNDYRISAMGPDGDPVWDAFDSAVAYNSRNNTYLVVWAGDDTPGGQVDEEYEIFGQLLSSSGTQLGYDDVRISFMGVTGSYYTRAFRPDVAFNSTYNEFLVVWSADNPEDGCVDNEFEIWGQVIDPAIFPLYGGNFRISFNGGSGDDAFDADNPAVAYNPDADEYLVVWEADDTVQGMVDNESEIFAQRVYSTGYLVGPNLRISDMGGSGDPLYDAFEPDVVYDGRNFEYLIVWSGDDNAGGLVDDEFEIYGQLITWNGLGTGPNDFRISDMGGTGNAGFDAYAPAAAYNTLRDEYLVVWVGDDNVGGLVEDEFEVFSQRFTPDIVGVGPNDLRLSDVGGVGNPDYDVACDPIYRERASVHVAYSPILDQYLVVWAGEDNVGGMVDGELEIFAQMLNGNVTDGIGPNDERISDVGGIGETAFVAYSPVVAANTWNGQFLVAWHGDDDEGSLVQGEWEIFTQRMDGMELFCDAFESGNTVGWSSALP